MSRDDKSGSFFIGTPAGPETDKHMKRKKKLLRLGFVLCFLFFYSSKRGFMSVQTNVVALGTGHAKSFSKSAHEARMAEDSFRLIIQIQSVGNGEEESAVVINPVKAKHVMPSPPHLRSASVRSFTHPRQPRFFINGSADRSITFFLFCFLEKTFQVTSFLCSCGG